MTLEEIIKQKIESIKEELINCNADSRRNELFSKMHVLEEVLYEIQKCIAKISSR